jgi:hypothetical protein
VGEIGRALRHGTDSDRFTWFWIQRFDIMPVLDAFAAGAVVEHF